MRWLCVQRVGLSLTNAERLLEVSRNQLNLRVTRNDLSLYLNTTPRTANRILNRLTELGAAVAVGTACFDDPYAPIKVRDGLASLAERQGLNKVSDFTGAVVPW